MSFAGAVSNMQPTSDGIPLEFYKFTVPAKECGLVFKYLQKDNMNKMCFDCGSSSPVWASATFGVFLCLDCAGNHRNVGRHISFVRSTQLDSWNIDELLRMWLGGNSRAAVAFKQGHLACLGQGTGINDVKARYSSLVARQYRDNLLRLTTANSSQTQQALSSMLTLLPHALEQWRMTRTSASSDTQASSSTMSPVPVPQSDAPTSRTTIPLATSNTVPTTPSSRIIMHTMPNNPVQSPTTWQFPTFTTPSNAAPVTHTFTLPAFSTPKPASQVIPPTVGKPTPLNSVLESQTLSIASPSQSSARVVPVSLDHKPTTTIALNVTSNEVVESETKLGTDDATTTLLSPITVEVPVLSDPNPMQSPPSKTPAVTNITETVKPQNPTKSQTAPPSSNFFKKIEDEDLFKAFM